VSIGSSGNYTLSQCDKASVFFIQVQSPMDRFMAVHLHCRWRQVACTHRCWVLCFSSVAHGSFNPSDDNERLNATIRRKLELTTLRRWHLYGRFSPASLSILVPIISKFIRTDSAFIVGSTPCTWAALRDRHRFSTAIPTFDYYLVWYRCFFVNQGLL